jgi:hypothetical protein
MDRVREEICRCISFETEASNPCDKSAQSWAGIFAHVSLSRKNVLPREKPLP